MSKKLRYVSVAVAIGGLVAWGSITYNSLVNTRSELSQLSSQITALETGLEETAYQLVRTEEYLTSTNLTISNLESELGLYRDLWGTVYTRDLHPERYAGLWQYLVNNPTASDPTFAQLLDFLREDRTDENPYVAKRYDCHRFARDVHDNAERAGIRAALVHVVTSAGLKHDLNAFKTTDRGLVFIDCTGVYEPEPGRAYCRIVDLKLGGHYSFRFLFPELSDTIVDTNIGTITRLVVVW